MTSTDFRFKIFVLKFADIFISGYVRQDGDWTCQDKGGWGEVEGRLWAVAVRPRDVPREVWQMPGERSFQNPSLLCSNKYLARVPHTIVVQRYFRFSTERSCCILKSWESCFLSLRIFFHLYCLAMTHPSWDLLSDWVANDLLVEQIHLTFGYAITRSTTSWTLLKIYLVLQVELRKVSSEKEKVQVRR